MTRIKEYQSDRNQYTRVAWPAGGDGRENCGVNQCDGCKRGLPVENGIHKGVDGEMIGCTADRYKHWWDKTRNPRCVFCGVAMKEVFIDAVEGLFDVLDEIIGDKGEA